MNVDLKTFESVARRFCSWVERADHNVATLHRLLAELLACAPLLGLTKPAETSERHGNDEKEYARRGVDGWNHDFALLKDLPIQHYWMVSPALQLESNEPVCFDLHDDLADIYGDLWHGLKAFDSGDFVYARESWFGSYRTHWGHHASGALYAVDEFLRSQFA